MGPIGGMNPVGFTPQSPISIRKTTEDANPVRVADGFEKTSAGSEVFNKAGLFNLMASSKPEAVHTDFKVTENITTNRVATDDQLVLNGINSKQISYLEI